MSLRLSLIDRIVPHGKSREAAEELATQIAKFPQMCMRSDRMSVYEQWDKTFQDAMLNEFHRGMEPIRKGETLHGATMFSKGVGKHGEF